MSTLTKKAVNRGNIQRRHDTEGDQAASRRSQAIGPAIRTRGPKIVESSDDIAGARAIHFAEPKGTGRRNAARGEPVLTALKFESDLIQECVEN
jgi:hypothetical protein